MGLLAEPAITSTPSKRTALGEISSRKCRRIIVAREWTVATWRSRAQLARSLDHSLAPYGITSGEDGRKLSLAQPDVQATESRDERGG